MAPRKWRLTFHWSGPGHCCRAAPACLAVAWQPGAGSQSGRPLNSIVRRQMQPPPQFADKTALYSYFLERPKSLEPFGTSDRCFTPAEAAAFVSSLEPCGLTLQGIEIWRRSGDRFDLAAPRDVWHDADTTAALRFVASAKPADLLTIQFA